MLEIPSRSPSTANLPAELTEYDGTAEPRRGAAAVAVKDVGVTFYVRLLRPRCLGWDVKIISLIYFSVNTSLCNVSSAIFDTFECARGKRYYCCARDDDAGHLAEKNGRLTVKHIALIRPSRAGRAEPEMHLSAQTLAHTLTHTRALTPPLTHAHIFISKVIKSLRKEASFENSNKCFNHFITKRVFNKWVMKRRRQVS